MGESIQTLWGITGEHLRQGVVRGFQALVLLVPLVFTSAIQEYGTPKLVLAEALVMLFAIFWLLSMVLDGEVLIVDTPLYYTFLALLAIGFVSLFLAHNIFQGLDIWFRQVCFFLIVILVFHTVQTPDQMEKITGTMVLAGGIVAIIGLLQHNGIYSFGAPWNLPISTIGNVNFTAQYYNAIFPITVALLFVVRGFWAQAGIGVACFLMSCHLVVLGSRGGWLGAGVSLVVLGGIGLLRHFQIGRRLIDVVVTMVVVIGLSWPVMANMIGEVRIDADRNVSHLVDAYWDRMTHRIDDAMRLEDDSSLQRVQLWSDTVSLISERPFLGVGLGNYEFSIPQFMSRESLEVKQRREAAVGQELMAFSAHNEYLEVWAETGLLGFLAFGVLLWQIGRSVFDLVLRYIHGEVSFLAVGFAASVIATLVHALFSTNLQQPVSAVHFWLVVGLIWALKLNVDRLTPLGLLATDARRVAIGVMGLCGIALMGSLFMGGRTIVGEIYYRRGEQAFRQEAYEVAQLQWQTASSYSPTRSYRTYQALGTSYYNQKKWHEAISAFQMSLAYFPNNARVQALLAKAFIQINDVDAAVKHGKQAATLNPLSAEFLTGWGEGLVKIGQQAQAIEVLGQAVVLNNNSIETHRLLGAAHKDLGNLDQAVVSYQRALQISPDDIDVLNSLAVVYSAQGELVSARQILEPLVGLAPDEVSYRFNLGIIQSELADYKAAQKTLEEVIRQSPNFVLAYGVLGQVLFKMGDKATARQAFDYALQLAPSDQQIKQMLNDLGWQ